MKNIYPLFVAAWLLILAACQTDNKKYYARDFNNPVLTRPANGSQIVLTENTNNDSLYFTWEPADYGFAAAMTYTVQMAKAGTYFGSAVKLVETQSTHAQVDYATLNNSALIAGLVPETPAEVEFRVVSSINQHIQTLRSESVTANLTAYNVAVNYPILFVPGNYQNWNAEDSSTILSSPKADQVYEGYLWFIPNTEFKLTGQAGWGALEWGGSNGKLVSKGGNILVGNTTASLYKVTANTNALTYTITPVSWNITGTATSGTPLPLTYNTTTRQLETTISLKAGLFVFQESGAGNRTLGVYFGNQLTDSGTEIIIPADGQYKISLNLSKYPYTYSLQ